MPTLGQTGSNSHTHPGLTFPQINNLRRGFPPSHTATPPKPSSTPQQQQSPYPPQQYTPQQPPQAPYPHHLFSSTTPSPVPTVSNIPNLPGSSQRHPPAQAAQHAQHTQHPQHPQHPQHAQHAQHAHAAVQAARQQQQQQQQSPHQRGGQQRQLQQQGVPPVAYLQQAMNQPVPQSVPQSVPQQVPQQMSQPVQQAQQLPQAQSIQQQVQAIQPQPVQPGQQQQQQQVRPNDSNLLPHTPPLHPQARPQAHPQAHQQAHPQAHQQTHQQTHQTHQQAHQQAHSQPSAQVHQQPPQLQPQPTPQPQHQASPAQHESAVKQPEAHHEDDMEVDSQADSPEEASHIAPKLIDGRPFVPRSPMGSMMSAPPEGGSFPSLDAVHKHVLEYCTSVGYAVVIGRSKKTVPGLKKVLFVCDRAGKPPSRVSPEQRKRKTSSRKCNCQFGFFAIEQRTQWTIRYRPDQAHLQHNHGPSESPLRHPAARKLDSKMVAAVKQLKENGIGVSQTLEILQSQNPHVPLLPRDIYNARAAITRNPSKVEAGIAEQRPAIYSKPAPTAEERIRSDLRRELARAKEELDKVKEDSKKEIEDLKAKLREKEKIIRKFEMFIDICNERVMVQRERLNDVDEQENNGEASSTSR